MNSTQVPQGDQMNSTQVPQGAETISEVVGDIFNLSEKVEVGIREFCGAVYGSSVTDEEQAPVSHNLLDELRVIRDRLSRCNELSSNANGVLGWGKAAETQKL